MKIQSLLSWTYKPKLGQNHAKMNQKRSFFPLQDLRTWLSRLWFIAFLFLEGYSFATHYLIFRLLHITMLEKNGKACNKKKSVLTQNLNVAWHYCFHPNHSGIIFQSTKNISTDRRIYIIWLSLCTLMPLRSCFLLPYILDCMRALLVYEWLYPQFELMSNICKYLKLFLLSLFFPTCDRSYGSSS